MFSFSFNKLSLSRQFLLISMGVTLLIISGITVYMVRSSIQAQTAQYQVMSDSRSAAVVEKIDRNFYERFGDVQAFAYNALAREMATDTISASGQNFINTMVSYYVLYDLMLVCNREGKVVAVNTKDKTGNAVDTKFLIGRDFSATDWFKQCVSTNGPAGGAWYSDFIKNEDVTQIYQRAGWGMGFAAPIKSESGEVIGAWYNFANWGDVTVGIRESTEADLRKQSSDAFILMTNSRGEVIDSDDHSMLLKTSLTTKTLEQDKAFMYHGRSIEPDDFVVGVSKGTGAYTYKGKGWISMTFIPRPVASFQYLFDNLFGFLLAMLIVLLVTGYIFHKLASSISGNIIRLKDNIERLAIGELTTVHETHLENEIGKITSAMRQLVSRMKETVEFAGGIGRGDLDSQYKSLGKQDQLGEALVAMRDDLSKIKLHETARTWVNEGIARFSELLRNQTDNKKLGDDVISALVRYMKANQGALFILNEEDASDTYMELTAAYAWERKKYLQKKIYAGEGLIGQCWLENDLIYLKDIPEDFVRITSGLGASNPTTVILLPLRYHDKVYGIIEMASFKEITDFQKEFLTKICDGIASAIATTRINDDTKKLLQQQQQQAEELRSQEEEMRQNMEELSATQEEMVRKEREYLKLISELEERTKSKSRPKVSSDEIL